MTDRFLGRVSEYLFGRAAPQHDAAVGIGANDRHRRRVDDRGERVFRLAHFVGRARRLLLAPFQQFRHAIEGIRENADLVAGGNFVRWPSSPDASTDASLPSCCNGRTMRRDNIQAIAKATTSATPANTRSTPAG